MKSTVFAGALLLSTVTLFGTETDFAAMIATALGQNTQPRVIAQRDGHITPIGSLTPTNPPSTPIAQNERPSPTATLTAQMAGIDMRVPGIVETQENLPEQVNQGVVRSRAEYEGNEQVNRGSVNQFRSTFRRRLF